MSARMAAICVPTHNSEGSLGQGSLREIDPAAAATLTVCQVLRSTLAMAARAAIATSAVAEHAKVCAGLARIQSSDTLAHILLG